MPLLKIQTNISFDEATQQSLLSRASQQLAEALGKPERYVMVAIQQPIPMLFAGDNDPLAYLELKSIGLQENQTAELSAMLCGLLDEYGIASDRIYIEFANAPRKMWGWNGATF